MGEKQTYPVLNTSYLSSLVLVDSLVQNFGLLFVFFSNTISTQKSLLKNHHCSINQHSLLGVGWAGSKYPVSLKTSYQLKVLGFSQKYIWGEVCTIWCFNKNEVKALVLQFYKMRKIAGNLRRTRLRQGSGKVVIVPVNSKLK